MSQPIDSGAGPGEPGWLPESVRTILLVSGSENGEWGGLAAIELADMIAGGRHRTLLVNTSAGSSGPDGALRTEAEPGLSDIIAGRRSVREVAITPPGRSFIFIPAGHPPFRMSDLATAPAFQHLVRAAGRGGTFLLFVSETDLPGLASVDDNRVCPGDFGGCVVLGDLADPGALPPGIKLLARVEEDAPPAPLGPNDAPSRGRAPGFMRPSSTPAMVAGTGVRRQPRSRLRRFFDDIRRQGMVRGVGGVAAVWVVAVLAVWLVWQGLSGWPAFQDDFETPIDSAPADRPGLAGVGEGESGSSDAGTPVAEGRVDAAVEPQTEESLPQAGSAGTGRVELRYSVLVISTVLFEDAEAKRDELTRLGSLAFISPTRIEGRGRLYFRVFGGALEDRLQATDLMRFLVDEGVKERERDWDMRPVTLAFSLADYGTEEEAESERDRLHDAGVPAYVVSVGDSTRATYRIYSGAFESEAAAGPADSMLSEAGLAATLVTRRGEPR